uniref:Vacuolar import/degradation Vid27 C-terminal domain-containing protein n=1 Tax=Spongospora subterranea TaxID=70186 RepID=A0A0H5RKE0_9EUKA|eukprot:CRZ09199.1 hypothetical protein [Spongospora subterranea]
MFAWLFSNRADTENGDVEERSSTTVESYADTVGERASGDHAPRPIGDASGSLTKYSEETGLFSTVLEVAYVHITPTVDPLKSFANTFSVYDEHGHVQVTQNLDHGMQIQFNKKDHSMVWILPMGDELDDELVTLGFTFDDPITEDSFKLLIATKLYESSRQESFVKTVKAQDQDWVLGSHAQVDEDAEVEDPMEVVSESEEENDESSHPRTPSRVSKDSSNAKNSHLAIGMGLDRSYVVRGPHIGVFKHGRDGMNHLATFDQVKGSDGTVFSPTKIMLHDRDRKMLMLRPDRLNSVVELDLETQQVVQEYQAEDETTIRDLGPHSRYSQMTGTELITGLNKNSVFAMDPRLNSQNKKVKGFSYAANPHLSCVAATGNAQYAFGSDKGEIRMFSDVGKRAKTLLPGLGHAITAIDTSEDGKWVLATTDRYIMLISAETSDGRTGFDVSLGKSKPVPIKLQLKPQDMVKYRIREVCFRKANFDMGEGKKEQWIVSATGNLLITWNMKNVLRGRINDYTVKVYDEAVVADQFRYGHSDIVVALPDDVKRAHFHPKKSNA